MVFGITYAMPQYFTLEFHFYQQILNLGCLDIIIEQKWLYLV